ncbi:MULTISPECIES: hypothetical protein [unclassified Synechocystis]|uniref:hypothetical protein n=1 Tax=unclassified Synechocystis TaxID=2640012 RepID=UPI00041BB75C|nr:MULTISPECIES: hypothetical protein [unclassified Synechocystis]AIE73920.1 hypothetical protein D082_13920 [Synechocystis sp. PCC 6714]MCT0252489.1 hypothetical protein [Synechocystis sp. CS-94]
MVFIPDESDFDVEYRSVPMPLDPKMLRMARRIYRSYRMLHPKSQRQPLGIAIHKETHRGQLMFNRQPVLLPGECFVPLNQLEAEAQVV